MNNFNRPGVIVLGGHVQGLGIIRIFGENGISSILLDNTNLNIARFSKYCNRFFKYKNDELLNKLLSKTLSNNYNNWLIIPTNDYHVKVLSQNYAKLSKHYKIAVDKWENVSKCYNKINTYKIADEIKVNIPITFFPKFEKEFDQISITYPCIIKPAVMHEFYSQIKKKVFICADVNELKFYYKKAIKIIPSDQIIIQEIIPGSSENQYSSCFLFVNGSSISELTARRKRQHPIDFGNATTFAEIVDIPELPKTAISLLKEMNYNGICEVEFKKDERDNTFKLLEINPRTWKWHSISEKAGIPFLINLYNHHYNLPYKENKSIDNSVAWKHIITDVPTIINLLLKRQYKKSKCQNIQYAVWNRKDIFPAIMELILLPVLIFKR